MRVIAGSHKGRRLQGPRQDNLRPTADRVKEALFSILTPRLSEARFLDLYAGTGAIGIEALSRGARQATFVEPDAASLKVLRANLAHCQLTSQSHVRDCTAATFLKRAAAEPAYDIVFADPPYAQAEAGLAVLADLSASPLVGPETTLILEHATKLRLGGEWGRLALTRQYRYGDTTLSVFHLQAEGALVS